VGATVRETVVTERGGAEDLNARIRDDSREVVDKTGAQTDRSPVEERRLQDNIILLTAGDHPGMRLTVDGTRVQGIGDARVKRLVEIAGVATDLIVLDGLHLESDGTQNNKATLLDISATSKVLIRNTTFRKAPGDGGDFVTIASGALVRFIGCAFLGGDNTTNVVNNAGAAGNVRQVEGANLTGSAHVNVTIVGEVT
jgi:hypothetical protein